MAAVAAEPGASAAATTTSREGAELEHEVVQPAAGEAKPKAEAAEQRAPVMDLVRVPKNGDVAQECSMGRAEAQRRPPQEAVGSAPLNPGGGRHAVEGSPESEPDAVQKSHGWKTADLTNLGCEEMNSDPELSPSEVTVNEVAQCGSPPRVQLAAGSEPALVALATGHTELVPSVPTETRLAATFLSVTDTTEPARGCAALVGQDPFGATDIQPDVRVLFDPPAVEPSSVPRQGGADLGTACSMNAIPASPRSTDHVTAGDANAGDPEVPVPVDVNHIPSASEPEPFYTTPSSADFQDPPLKSALSGGEDEGLRTESIAHLIPGSEVRVSLDHIIDDALVVSFRLGEKIFSGVLMDLSKRFGPYGIPVTVFPKREYRDKPETMQLKVEPLLSEAEKGQEQGTPDEQQGEGCQAPVPEPTPSQWTLKPPPLFQEGVPYPPPLFIRDTYSQSLPQPPPRKIKRPKRKLYREEPTSIMNAIKLRPRQVLCDKCKGAVTAGDKREVRRGPGADCRTEEAKRRRGDGGTGTGKKPRTESRAEERGRVAEGSRKQTPAVRVTAAVGQAKGPGMVKVDTVTASPASRIQLSTKKVLQSKNVDHSKAREVLKMARVAHRRQRDKVDAGAPVARASSPQDAQQKVHFTRRLHQISGGGEAVAANSAPLPPRIRIKPQRYRSEENSSSACKALAFERGPGSGTRATARPVPARCASTRSSCSAVPAVVAAENHSLSGDLEFEHSPQLPCQHPPHPELTHSPQARDLEMESEESGVREERRERRGAKAGSLAVYVSLNPSQPDSSSVSVCSVDSVDDLKSSNSECSSTETFDLPPPGALHSPPVPSSSSPVSASSTTPAFSSSSSSSSAIKEEKKPSKPLKAAVFSKNVSKCVTADGRTICVGDIVWAKIYGFPWWPARILVITVSRKDNGLLVRQEARISWFGSPTTSFLALSQVTPFLENFQSRFDKKRKGLYRKAIAEAAKAAKQLTPEVRALLTQFET